MPSPAPFHQVVGYMFGCPHDSIIPGTLNVLILKAGQRRVRLATYGGRALGEEVFRLIVGHTYVFPNVGR